MAPKVLPTAISLGRKVSGGSISIAHPSLRKLEYVPHACEELHQTTVPKGERHHEIRLRNAAGPHVDQTQDEGGQGERAQSQRSGVGELAALDGLVGTRLELTTKGRQEARFGGVDLSERAIPEASGFLRGLVLLGGHVAGDVGLLGASGLAGVGGRGVLLALVACAVVARGGCHRARLDDDVDLRWIGQQELCSRVAISKQPSAVAVTAYEEIEEEEAIQRASSQDAASRTEKR